MVESALIDIWVKTKPKSDIIFPLEFGCVFTIECWKHSNNTLGIQLTLGCLFDWVNIGCNLTDCLDQILPNYTRWNDAVCPVKTLSYSTHLNPLCHPQFQSTTETWITVLQLSDPMWNAWRFLIACWNILYVSKNISSLLWFSFRSPQR